MNGLKKLKAAIRVPSFILNALTAVASIYHGLTMKPTLLNDAETVRINKLYAESQGKTFDPEHQELLYNYQHKKSDRE